MMEREGCRRPQLDRVWPWHYVIDRHAVRPAALAAIVAVALLLRFGLIFGGRLWETAYIAEDWPIAQHLAAGDGFSATGLHPCAEFTVPFEQRDRCLEDFGVRGDNVGPTSQKNPGVPALLALALLVGGLHPFLWFQLLHAAVGAAACWWLGRLGERAFGARTGLVAALLLALYVPLIWWVKYPGEHILAGAMLVVILLGLHRLETAPTTGLFVGWGALIGLSGLFSADVLLPVPLFAAWLAWRHRRRGWARAVAGPIVAGAVAILVIAPWTARNYRVHGELVLVRTGFGTSLWWGNNPQATGTDWSFVPGADGQPRRVPGLLLMPDELRRELAPMSETDQESRLMQEALGWIAAEPGRAAWLFLKKLGYYWWFVYHAEVDPIPIAREIGWVGVLLCAILGIVLALRGPPLATRGDPGRSEDDLSDGATSPESFPDAGFVLLLLVPIATSMLFHAATVISGSWRMRLPIEPVLLLLAAYGLTCVMERAIHRHS